MRFLDASVIIYTYDRKDYILNALHSVVNQTLDRSRYEIIVVKGFKDAGIDREIESKADFNLYIHEKAHGKKLAPAIAASKGDVVFILDDDDQFVHNKLEKIMHFFQDDPELIFSHNSVLKVDSLNKPLKLGQEPLPRTAYWLDTRNFTRGELSRFLKFRANWYSSCMAFRRDAIFPYLDHLERITQSVDPFLFFMVLTAKGKMLLVPERLSLYRVHSSTTNYSMPFKDYISRRSEFYRNTLTMFYQAKKMSVGKPSQEFVEASISNMKLIVEFLNLQGSRFTLLRAMFASISHLKIAFTVANVYWLCFSSLKLIFGNGSLRIYHLLNHMTAGIS